MSVVATVGVAIIGVIACGSDENARPVVFSHGPVSAPIALPESKTVPGLAACRATPVGSPTPRCTRAAGATNSHATELGIDTRVHLIMSSSVFLTASSAALLSPASPLHPKAPC